MSDRTLEARFTLNQYTINATAGIGGTVIGSSTYDYNADVTLTATANTGYIFDGWYENNQKITGAGATYSFKATTNRTLEARFISDQVVITPDPSGVVSIPASRLQSASLLKVDGDVTLTFDKTAIQAMGSQGNVVITLREAEPGKLNDDAKQLAGDRPVYEFTVNVNGQNITDFGDGTVRISIPYTPKTDENINCILVYYIDKDGKPVTVKNSVYKNGFLSFNTDHFSIYAVGYNKINFNDTVEHWAESYIDFVAVRELFKGTGEGLFSPEDSMTRAMFATALSRLDGADLSGYTSSRFSDVPTGEYYSAAVEWAADNNIVTGVGDNKFEPDTNISREQMAVMLVRYMNYKGYAIESAETTEFADEASIDSYAFDAVKIVQAAGIVTGKPGNLFDPQGIATRAEVATIYARFIDCLAN